MDDCHALHGADATEREQKTSTVGELHPGLAVRVKPQGGSRSSKA